MEIGESQINSKGTKMTLLDRRHKKTWYNFLVNINTPENTSELSKFFENIEDAQEYINLIKSKSDFKPIQNQEWPEDIL